MDDVVGLTGEGVRVREYVCRSGHMYVGTNMRVAVNPVFKGGRARESTRESGTNVGDARKRQRERVGKKQDIK